MVTSYTHSTIEREPPLQDKGMSIQELVAKYMNGNENVAIMSHEGQHETLRSNLEVTKEEENLNYNEEITSRDDEKLEKIQNLENDTQTLKELVVKEEE